MKTEQIEKQIIQKLILTALKEAYFRRAKKEKLESTEQLTFELDLLEIAIRELADSINNEK
jgi:DNA-binding protein YbaB